MKEILKAINISKTYEKTGEKLNILRNINLSILKSEIVVLVGPSGSGKSTLLNILGTLDTNYNGQLIIEGKILNNAVDLAPIRRNKIGFIFQFHHLLPEFTIYENLQIPRMIQGGNNNYKDILDMLKYVGLYKRLNHYPDEISGGEKQKIAVLRALVNNPPLIIADEPTGNLDSENSQILLNLISDLRVKYNKSFIIATHDKTIFDIADRIFLLKDGKLINN